MASTSNAAARPVRGILKTSKSDIQQNDINKSKEAARFDELNILATYHPADKDYGHMKIDEPKTPYRHDRDEEPNSVDPDELTQRLTESGSQNRARTVSSGDDDEYVTPQSKEKKEEFEAHRKKHYDMREDMRRAKALLAKEMTEMEDD